MSALVGVDERVRIDLSLMPTEAFDSLCAATLDFIHRIENQPGGREALEAEQRKYEAERGEVKNVQR